LAGVIGHIDIIVSPTAVVNSIFSAGSCRVGEVFRADRISRRFGACNVGGNNAEDHGNEREEDGDSKEKLEADGFGEEISGCDWLHL
jgi:hypothetical protein